jgi:hypothetical protein
MDWIRVRTEIGRRRLHDMGRPTLIVNFGSNLVVRIGTDIKSTHWISLFDFSCNDKWDSGFLTSDHRRRPPTTLLFTWQLTTPTVRPILRVSSHILQLIHLPKLPRYLTGRWTRVLRLSQLPPGVMKYFLDHVGMWRYGTTSYTILLTESSNPEKRKAKFAESYWTIYLKFILFF